MHDSESYFQQRDAVIQQYVDLDYVDIDAFLREVGMSIGDMIGSGMVYEKQKTSLADLHDYVVTRQGSTFLYEVSSHQLILVKPGQFDALLFALEKAKSRLDLIKIPNKYSPV